MTHKALGWPVCGATPSEGRKDAPEGKILLLVSPMSSDFVDEAVEAAAQLLKDASLRKMQAADLTLAIGGGAR